jgi:hypothetical protein
VLQAETIRVNIPPGICHVDGEFIESGAERMIEPVTRRKLKLYPIEQVNRVHVVRLLIEENGSEPRTDRGGPPHVRTNDPHAREFNEVLGMKKNSRFPA